MPHDSRESFGTSGYAQFRRTEQLRPSTSKLVMHEITSQHAEEQKQDDLVVMDETESFEHLPKLEGNVTSLQF